MRPDGDGDGNANLRPAPRRPGVEWPTLSMIVGGYAAWVVATVWLPGVSLAAAVVVAALAVALFSSLQHEAIHGHPTGVRRLDEALVYPALSLVIPYDRFRDTHLAHHLDADLTDPYDDPESNYLDPVRWAGLPGWLKAVLSANNTLLGRMVLGPLVSQAGFVMSEACAHRAGDARVVRGWLRHMPAAALVALWVWTAPMPVWAYLMAVWAGLGLIKVRTFLEHRAHAASRARTAIVEDSGPLSWLFLNNNLHVVHHAHPEVPWYRLPALYRARRARFLALNEGYVYRGYGEVFRRYLLGRKDPVPHPLMQPRP